jgi:formylglycine-generating enzyme required for sulfatase activity
MTRNALLALGLALPAAAPAAGEPDRAERILKQFVEEFVPLTPGAGKFPATFRMGSDGGDASEQPAHEVRFRRPFAVARYEVTQELYEVVAGQNPSRWKGPRNSVEMVSWDEAVAFCAKVTAELRRRKLLAEGEEVRLPSEAEWEYACRAGTTTAYSFGDRVEDLRDHAWYKPNSPGEDPPVGKKKSNAWGLYDCHGYVWEWCQDAWQVNYRGAPADGSAVQVPGAEERVLRGGSFADDAESCRSASRRREAAGTRSDKIGFRCVRAAVNAK